MTTIFMFFWDGFSEPAPGPDTIGRTVRIARTVGTEVEVNRTISGTVKINRTISGTVERN